VGRKKIGGVMGKVIHIDRDLQEMFEKLEALKGYDIHSLCVVATHGKGMEEFFFVGAPAMIYQALALAQGHILQNYSLMDGCECECECGEED
jgi:hypothetical protein